jgi:hypothetical protein
MLMLALPLVVGVALTPPGATWTWIYVNPGDSFIYLAQAGQGSGGQWGFVNVWTWQPMPNVPLFPFYSLLGHLVPGAVFGPTSVGFAYQAARLVIAGLTLWQAWKLLREVTPSLVARRVGFLLAFFGSGFGLYELAVPALREAPRGLWDLYFGESSTFGALIGVPHHGLVLLAFIFAMRAFLSLLSRPQGNWRAAGVAAAATAVVAMVHPDKVAVLLLTAALAVLWLAPREAFRLPLLGQLGLVVAAGSAWLGVLLVLVLGRPESAGLALRGSHLPNPNPLFYLLGLGLPGLLALWAAPVTRARLRRASPGQVVAWSFVVASVLETCIPTDLVDHRLEGVQLALAGIAAGALVHGLVPRLGRAGWFNRLAAWRGLPMDRRRLRSLAINLVVLAAVPTTLVTLVSFSATPVNGARDLYLEPGGAEAMAWIRGHTEPDAVILATPPTARFIAAYGVRHVAFGNASMTPDYDAEERATAQFFRPGEMDRHGYLRARRVSYLYFGVLEAATVAFEPRTEGYLQPVYENGKVTIFRVT